jgi:DGQHR domain-containing protein
MSSVKIAHVMSNGTLDLTFDIPAIRGYCGNWLSTYATQIRPSHIQNVLGHDPRSRNWRNLRPEVREIYEHLQRKTDKSRRDSIADYIEERFSPDANTIGAFGAISIGFVESIRFIEDETIKGIGKLCIDISQSNFRVMLDGLGRVTGALDLGEENPDIFNNFVFPVTIFAPSQPMAKLTYDQMGQLFHDMNFKVQPVVKNHAVSLDTSDPYITLANQLALIPVIKDNGGVAKRMASLGKKSSELVVQTVLIRFVRGALEGRPFQESNMATARYPNLTRPNFNSALFGVSEFLTSFANAMGEKFRDKDRESLHLTSPGWQALGVLHHDLRYKLKLSETEIKDHAKLAAAIDWSRFNPDWTPMLGPPETNKFSGKPVVDAQGRTRVAIAGAGRSNVQHILDYLRLKLNLTEKLTKIGKGTLDSLPVETATDQ